MQIGSVASKHVIDALEAPIGSRTVGFGCWGFVASKLEFRRGILHEGASSCELVKGPRELVWDSLLLWIWRKGLV